MQTSLPEWGLNPLHKSLFRASGLALLSSFTISALSSADSISGGNGTDTLSLADSGSLSDSAFTNVSGVEVLALAAGGNSLSLSSAFNASGITTVQGGSGTDSLTLAGDQTLTLSGGSAISIGAVTYNSIEQVSLSGGNSTLIGSSGDDSLTISGAGSGTASPDLPFSGIQ